MDNATRPTDLFVAKEWEGERAIPTVATRIEKLDFSSPGEASRSIHEFLQETRRRVRAAEERRVRLSLK